jgi:hypothetical protein
METRCTSCGTVIPVGAKYCPRCGTAAPTGPSRPTLAPNAHPTTAPIPRAGKFLFGLGAIGLGLLVVGFLTRNPPVIYVGAGIVALLILTILAGDLLS